MLLAGDWVLPVSGPPLADGAIVIAEGAIAAVGPAAELRARYPDEQTRKLPGCALLPGLINVHTHLDYSAFQGFASSSGFSRWMWRLLRARRKLGSEDLAASALWGAYECVRNGVTSIADTSYEGSTVARAAGAAGLRARVYLEVFGLDDTRLRATMERLEAALQRVRREPMGEAAWREPIAEAYKSAISILYKTSYRTLYDSAPRRGEHRDPRAGAHDEPHREAPGGPRGGVPGAATAAGHLVEVDWGISPHAPYTVSQELYREVARLARLNGLRMATHLGESPAEVGLLAGRPTALALVYKAAHMWTGRRWRPPRLSPVQYVDGAEALGPDMLVVHAVQVDGVDLATMASRGAPVAHCPRSNARLRTGTAPVAEMRAAGITVGLGTDSLASNDSLDMLAEMRAALAVSLGRAPGEGPSSGGGAPPTGWLSPSAVLQMATLDGARALGWDRLVGSLEVGKRADLVAIRLPPREAPGGSGVTEDLARTVMDGEVQMTMVDGVVVYDGAGIPAEAVLGLRAARKKLGLED